MARLGRTGFGNSDGFPIDGADDAFPAREGFSEADFDGRDEVVVVALKVGVFFLLGVVSTDTWNKLERMEDLLQRQSDARPVDRPPPGHQPPYT